MTHLHPKMLEDLRLRGLSKRTTKQYLICVSVFTRFHNVASPDRLSTEDVRAFLLHLAEQGRSSSTQAGYHAALKFLFVETLVRPEVMHAIPRPRVRSQITGRVLTRAEARALLDALVHRPFDYTFFALMLATGLRISEAAALQLRDIDRRAGLIHVRSGKGDKTRSVMLSKRTLKLLERYWVVVQPKPPFLFPARKGGGPQRATLRPWAGHAVCTKIMADRLRHYQPDGPLRVHSHDLRRTFATWLIEDGCNLRLVQVLLGHASPETTARYTRIHTDLIADTISPYDKL